MTHRPSASSMDGTECRHNRYGPVTSAPQTVAVEASPPRARSETRQLRDPDMLFRFLARLGAPFALFAALLEPADRRDT